VRLPTLLYQVYERRLIRNLAGAPLPHHVGVIVDGNRRWARKEGMTNPNDGHRAGAAHISNLLEWCSGIGIGMVTLWLLSTDNLRRSDGELQPLLSIIADVVDDLAAPDEPWKLRIVGAMEVLPSWMVTRLTAASAGRSTSRSGTAAGRRSPTR
jgi:short-chain Z-isoprenyl diphosphate synthase